MGAFDMMGRLVLSTSKWDEAIGRADAKATAFADKVEHKLSKKISKLFGAGAFAGLIYHPIAKVFGGAMGIGEESQKIEEGANKLKITTDQYQGLENAAKEAGLGVDEFISAVKKGDIPLQEALKSINEYKGGIDALTIANEASYESSLNQANSWIKQGAAWASDTIAGMARAAGTLWAGWRTGASWDEMKKNFRDTEAGIRESVQPKKLKPLEEIFGAEKGNRGKSVNEWQRIGDYVGGGTVESDIAAIKENTAKTANAVARMASDGGPPALTEEAPQMDWRIW